MTSTVQLIATLFLLSSGGTSGLTASSRKFGSMQSSVISLKSPSIPPKFISRKVKRSNSQSHYWQASSRLTSTHIEARNLHKSFSWLPRISSPFQWGKRLLKKRGSKRFIISAILGAFIVFAPAFSPAHAASAAKSTLRIQNVPFPQSKALGTFNFLPTKAELELSFRLLYASCSAAFIGLERSASDRPAGVRTMALVGLGACIYTICSTHGFLPHSALGYAPGSPMLENVKCDPGRMAANVASGVGFIGAGAIHKSKQHGNGTEVQNVVAGLTTAAAIWVSAAVGVASAVGLYFVGGVASLATVVILKFAKVPNEDKPGFSWQPKPLDVVEDEHGKAYTNQKPNIASVERDDLSGLFSKSHGSSSGIRSPEQDILARYYSGHPPIIIKEIVDPRFEQYLRSQLGNNDGAINKESPRASQPLIEEEQQVVSNCKNTENDQDFPLKL